MIVYPTSPVPQLPYEITFEYRTAISKFETGRELAHQLWRFPRRRVNLKYAVLRPEEIQTLWAFYQGRRGAALPFYFIDEFSVTSLDAPFSHTDQYVGRGNGITTIYELPGKSTSMQTIFLDGVQQGDVIILSGGGFGGVDRVQFSQAPAAGVLITANFTGHLRILMRFAEDSLSREMFSARLYRTGIDLIERKPA